MIFFNTEALKSYKSKLKLNAAVELKEHDEKGCLKVVKSIGKNEKELSICNLFFKPTTKYKLDKVNKR